MRHETNQHQLLSELLELCEVEFTEEVGWSGTIYCLSLSFSPGPLTCSTAFCLEVAITPDSQTKEIQKNLFFFSSFYQVFAPFVK